MGRDKAALIIGNQPLWQHQLATLRDAGADEFLISGRSDGPYATAGVPVIADEQPELGPLGGLVSSLRRAQHEWVLVLAIDLPLMTPAFLRQLVEDAAATKRGVLPQSPSGWEPLAAVYPRACLQPAEACLERRELSLQNFASRAEAEGLLIAHPITGAESQLFLNLNTEDDLRRLPG
jgi:molybdopterin-guanine dinucleotide biosynthesis protein A